MTPPQEENPLLVGSAVMLIRSFSVPVFLGLVLSVMTKGCSLFFSVFVVVIVYSCVGCVDNYARFPFLAKWALLCFGGFVFLV